jgi:hypothetical protein
VFTGKGENDQGLQPFAISDFADVKRVKGKKLEISTSLNKLCFSKKDGTEIAKVELTNESVYGPEFVLDDSEEIIGIFGTKNADNHIWQLGFIVWKPPHF